MSATDEAPFTPATDSSAAMLVLLGTVATGGLFGAAWAVRLGRRLHMPVRRLALGAGSGIAWFAGLAFFAKGVLIPRTSDYGGNTPLFIGFSLTTLGIVGGLLFANELVRLLDPASQKALRLRAVASAGATAGFLLAQLPREMLPPLQDFSQLIVSLFQLSCLAVATMAAMQWTERVHAQAESLVTFVAKPTTAKASSETPGAVHRF